MRLFYVLFGLVASLITQVHGKAVFAHFMVGNADNYTQSDWERDIGLAQEAHIDAFALNIANDVDGIVPALQLAFYVASQTSFKLFFSFDYAGNGAWDKDDVISLCTSYCNNPAYFHTHGGPLLSSFEGPENGADWHQIKAATGCFFMPDWSSLGAKEALEQADGVADGLFNWAAWPWGDREMDTYTDASYWMYLKQSGDKPYMMPASPWFYTNLPGYNKNWLWRGDHSWYDRWVQIIYNQPDFVQIISWNDYGESHHIGPLYDKGMEAFTIGKAPFNYASNMPHDGWRAFLPYLIDLYKKGTATITEEGVQGWWRRAAAGACDDGGTTGNTASQLLLEFPPAAVVADKVFFSALLGSHAEVFVTVGGTVLDAAWTWTPDDGVGVYHGSADFGTATGDVVIIIRRSGQTIATLNPGSAGSIGPQSCVNGLQNWNAYVASAWGGSISATPTLEVSEQKCIQGTGYGNFAGLCHFACQYGYCNPSACVCQAMGSPSATPSGVAAGGYPAAGLSASYSGLCAFNCAYGYCPPSACSYEESPLSTPTVSEFSPPSCIGGSAIDGPGSPLGGLCSYACNFGFCPYRVCHCDGQGALHETPAKIPGKSGKAADGVADHGLCSFACERGYCPASTCVDSTSSSTDRETGGGDSGSPALPGGVFFEGDLSGETGQYCYKSKCSKNPINDNLESDQTFAGPFFRDDCDEGEYRMVICPVDGNPGQCTWRGGGPLCLGTCNAGEVAITTSTHGESKCSVGEQVLCCVSGTWAALVSSCSWKAEWDGCGVGQSSVATRVRHRCGGCLQYTGYKEHYCCDLDFPGCKWADCNKSYCLSQKELQVASNPYSGCGSTPWNRLGVERALCCEPPKQVNPYLPVALDYLFPTLPDEESIPVFNITQIHMQRGNANIRGPLQPFGFVVIDGPAHLVTSFSKRDGSHVEFLDCEGSQKHNMTIYTARYICTNDSHESNCDDVHLDGADGTVVKLPEECGYATYGVVHEIKASHDQRLPHELRKRAPDNTIVHEVSFSYDFTKVKRAANDDPVYVRIDYSSMAQWWDSVVLEPPIRGKRDSNAAMRKRFWSANEDVWRRKIDHVRNSTDDAFNKPLAIVIPHFSKTIYQQTSETCAAPSSRRGVFDDGFLSVNLNGYLYADQRWGYSLVGTISPTLNIEEAHGFYDVSFLSVGELSVNGAGELQIDGDLPVAKLLGRDGITDFGWTHPGLVSFKPTLNLEVEMTGSGRLDGNFNISYVTLPHTMIRTNSVNMGDFSGTVAAVAQREGHYSGAVTASSTSKTGDSGVVLGVRVMPKAQMEFTLFDYADENKATLDKRSAALASAEFGAQLNHKFQLLANGTEVQVRDSYDSSIAWVRSSNVSPDWTAGDIGTVPLEPGPSPAVLYRGEGEEPGARSPPDLAGDATFDGAFMHCSGSSTSTDTCLSLIALSEIDTDLKDDYDGENAAANSEGKRARRAVLPGRSVVPFWDVAQQIKDRETPTRTHELLPRKTEAVTVTVGLACSWCLDRHICGLT